jgi:hypothetical protein
MAASSLTTTTMPQGSVNVQAITATGSTKFQIGHKYTTRRTTSFDSKNRREILNWLSPLSFRETHERIASEAMLKDQSELPSEEQYHAGKWLLDSDTFDSWRSGEANHRRLWYYGMRTILIPLHNSGRTIFANLHQLEPERPS